jgi:hypothetical protein
MELISPKICKSKRRYLLDIKRTLSSNTWGFDTLAVTILLENIPFAWVYIILIVLGRVEDAIWTILFLSMRKSPF